MDVRVMTPLVRMLPWLVLVIGLVITAFIYQLAFSSARQFQQANFNSQSDEIVLRIEQRLATYQQVLRGLQGLYVSSASVERDEFRHYEQSLFLEENYPGIQGVGYSTIIPRQEKEHHIARVRHEGFPSYDMFPEGERDLYTSIIHLEPFSGRNLLAFGFDMYSEKTRRAAMERARDTDQPVMSAKVKLVQEAGQKEQAGLLIYLPVYRNGSPHGTLDERRANILGWVYAPFRINDLMQGVLGDRVRHIDYEIFDGERATPESLLYDSDNHLALNKDAALYHAVHAVRIADRTWTINLRSLPDFETDFDAGRGTVIVLAGVLMSILVSLIVWQSLNGRARALMLARSMTQQLRDNLESMRKLNRELEDAQNHLMQSDKMASIGQLAAGVAHEINNPIGYVHSNLGTLEKYLQDTFSMLDLYEQAEKSIADPDVLARLKLAKDELDIDFIRDDLGALMGESKEGITRVKKIVQNLKDFSHADTSDEWRFADLHSGLESTLNIVNNEIKYKAEVVREYGVLPDVECLASQLNQVFMNLLVNAAHAIETRGTITIRTGCLGDEAWVEISDSGKGIAQENLKKIFDPFFTTKPVGQGTGLGLSLSYGIVRKHHGRIEVDSEVGRGTTFRVWLPVRQPIMAKGDTHE